MSTPYDEAAEIYEMGGLSPIPILGKDIPVSGATGYNGTVTPEKIMQWLHPDEMVRAKAGRGHALRNIAQRHQLTVAVDVDHGYGDKDGVGQLAEYARKMSLSPLPPTWSSTARGDDSPSRQHIYSIPEDVPLKTKPCKSVELCCWHHRFTVVAPSIHPKINKPYCWYLPGQAGIPPVWGPRTTRYPRHSDFTPLPMDWFAAFRGSAINADRSALTVAMPDLVATFQQGEPDALVAWKIRKWEAEHVGHDEFKQAMINALLMGREGYIGVEKLVQLLLDRFTGYVEVERPHQAAHEVESLTAFCSDIAQQKPVKPKDSVTVIYLKRGDSPDPKDFMAGAEFEFVDEDELITEQDIEDFIATFTRSTKPHLLMYLESWMRRDPPTAMQRHTNRAFTAVLAGDYSAEQAIRTVLIGCLHHGIEADPIIKSALGAILNAKVSA